MSQRAIRCLSPALLAIAILLLGATSALAQHTTGFNMTKTCPTVVASGASFQCSVTLSNNDLDHGVINLVVTNTVPSPGGPTTNLDCRQPFNPADCTAGSVVTTLGPSGSLTAACGACIPETAPINCGSSNISYVDEVRAVGTDAAEPPSPFVGLPVSSSTTNATPVAPLVCGDNNACTTDSCSTETGCSNTPISCGDNNACTTDSCDPATGCVNTPVSCGDNNACTSDSCDPATGCLNVPVSCGDNNACTTDSCDPATGCVNTPVSCGDNNACTTDSCNPATGCVNAAVSCDDNNSCTDDSCDPASGCVNTDNGSCNGLPGRMTGGGSVFGKGSQRVTHGFELHCDPEVGPNNLEVNWGGNHFHMEELLTAVCTDDPSIAPPPPPAGFDTYTGTGTGRCNGADGATISFVFTDAGEPGKFDTAEIQISGCPSGGGITVSGPLKKGNHQAHAH
jgi:Dictyostelium (slime mold) repeat